MKLLFTLTLSLLLFQLVAQESFTVSGVIKDGATGEDLPFVSVSVEGTTIGSNSNIRGFYSLSLPAGNHTLIFSSIGFQTISKDINLQADLKVNMELNEESIELEVAEVVVSQSDQRVERNDGSVETIDPLAIKDFPTIGGERDPMRVLEQKPGFKSAGEGNSGFYVRGGGLDQNLILLDEAPVYNPSHLLGFFSVFNGDALKTIDAYKGGMNAEYGGRTSSVMDITMRDGNSKKLNVSGGIGIIASRLTVEAPIVKDKGSFIISGRRTYADLFLGLSSDDALSNSELFFYDLNMKANYQVTERDRVYLSGYFGRDRFGFSDAFGLTWGNATGTARWNHIFKGDRWFMNTAFIYRDYDYQFQINDDEDEIALESVIRGWNFKQDFTHYKNNNNTIKLGYNLIHHTIQPGNLTAGSNTGINSEDAKEKYGLEGAVFVQNNYKASDRLKINYGLRYSWFTQLGPGTIFNFNDSGDLESTSSFESGESPQFYQGWEPRLSMNYKLDSISSLKLGFNRYFQYIHLLSNATSSTPTDVWVMSSNNVAPQSANLLSLGYFRSFNEGKYTFSAETYYKLMDYVLDYRNGANLFFNDELEGDLLS